MRGRLTTCLLVVCSAAIAQSQERATWELSVQPESAAPGSKVLVKAAAHVQTGWHLYSASTPAGTPTSFQVGPENVVESARILQPQPKRVFDAAFQSDTESYEGDVAFLVEVQLRKNAPAGPGELTVRSRYQTCSDTQCIPGKWTKTLALAIDPAAQAAAPAIPAGYAEAKPPAATEGTAPADQALGAFLLVAFGFGIASIFTPCVFPMIPITMSYFLNRQSGGRRDAVTQAAVFCIGIVVLFSGLGLATSAILGPASVKQLGANPWVNGFISALLIAFGLSLLGAFEITVPSSILTRLNQSSDKGGFGGTVLMGLTFSLSSFACVGPFVGTLLAASVGGTSWRPLFGMVAFASGLALPFFLLAIFPSYLKRLPRSGGWLARVKVVMGFVILAASLKYLAGVDAAAGWGVLTRERFLAAWVVLFAMAGLYLLGFVRLEGVKPDESMGLGRLLVGMGLLMFSLSLVPGMLGRPLGDLDAYVPAAAGGADVGGGTHSKLVWMTDQYRAALDRARREGKLLFVDFTGVSCANCHWMRANIFPRPAVEAALEGFVLVELYTDRFGDPVSDENQKLQLAKFKTIAQPFYAILDANENAIVTFDHRTSDEQEFVAFLRKGQQPATAPTNSAAVDLPQVKQLDGAPFNAASLAGKVVVVNFWATWCVPCIGEIPTFNEIHRDFASKGVVVLGVLSLDEDGVPKVPDFQKKHPMAYTVAVGSDATAQKYQLDNLPVTVVFDRSGKLVQRFGESASREALRAAVDKAL